MSDIAYQSFFVPDKHGHQRRVRILLPHRYFQEPSARFPVMYLHDAQNLFGVGEGYGSWRLENPYLKSGSWYRDHLILVGIDHAGVHRIKEFSAHSHIHTLSGPPFDYFHFVFLHLKPNIDHHFRTLPNRENTGLGGSSMGAMTSLYASYFYNHHFSKLMLFSPSLWIVPKFLYDAQRLSYSTEFKVYIYAGVRESRYMLHHAGQLAAAFSRNSSLDVTFSFRKNGKHREYDWGKHFAIASRYLFAGR